MIILCYHRRNTARAKQTKHHNPQSTCMLRVKNKVKISQYHILKLLTIYRSFYVVSIMYNIQTFYMHMHELRMLFSVLEIVNITNSPVKEIKDIVLYYIADIIKYVCVYVYVCMCNIHQTKGLMCML